MYKAILDSSLYRKYAEETLKQLSTNTMNPDELANRLAVTISIPILLAQFYTHEFLDIPYDRSKYEDLYTFYNVEKII